MADQGIKKVIIPKESLPEVFGTTQQYILKYRIVSEDKNRNSHWSPQYKLNKPNVNLIPFSFVVNSESNTATAIWTPPAGISSFDVYVSYDESSSWSYLATVGTNTYALIMQEDITSIKIAVQVPTFPKERFSGATLFESDSMVV